MACDTCVLPITRCIVNYKWFAKIPLLILLHNALTWKFPPHLVCLPWPSERPHSHHWVIKSVLHMTSTLQQPSTSSRLALPNHTSIFPCLESHAGVRHAMRPLSWAVGITHICNVLHFPMVGCPGTVTKSFQVAEPTGQCIGPSPVLSVCVHFLYNQSTEFYEK